MLECRIERQSEHEADCEFARSDFQSGYGECCELAALDRGQHHYLKSDYDGVEYNRHKRREHREFFYLYRQAEYFRLRKADRPWHHPE